MRNGFRRDPAPAPVSGRYYRISTSLPLPQTGPSPVVQSSARRDNARGYASASGRLPSTSPVTTLPRAANPRENSWVDPLDYVIGPLSRPLATLSPHGGARG